MKTKISISIILLMIFPFAAFSYIDPGSGSALLAALIGSFAVAGMIVKSYYFKLKNFFTTKKSSSEDEESNSTK